MSGGNQITRELGIGELLSQTYDSFKQNFMKYFVVYLVIEAIIGVLTTITMRAVVVPQLGSMPTTSQVFAYSGAELSVGLVTGIATLIFGTIAIGTAIKIASEGIEGRQIGVRGGVKFIISKLIWIWLLGLIVGVLVILGMIALIVPGIILAIMFSLALPVYLIESPGVLDSLTRSRKLVGERWLKTLGFLLILGIIVGIIGLIGDWVGHLFGPASTIVSDLIAALYSPIMPVGLTVYYYSNFARLAPPAPLQPAPTGMPPATLQPGMKFCPSCGNQLRTEAIFCSKCGAKQPA